MTKTKSNFRHACAALALAFCTLAGPSVAQDCQPRHRFQTIKPGVLTVAGFEFPPYVFASEGSIDGIDADVLKRFAAKECLRVEGSIMDASAVIQSVLSGRADVAAGIWYRTAERAKVLGLVHPVYLDKMGLYSKEGYASISDLLGKRVGTVQGYLWVDDLRKLVGSELKLYPNPAAMGRDLAAGRIDVGADSYDVGVIAQRKGAFPGIRIEVARPDNRVKASVSPGQAGLPYTKSNTALGEALDDHIRELHSSGEIKTILESFGLDPTASDVGEPRLIE